MNKANFYMTDLTKLTNLRRELGQVGQVGQGIFFAMRLWKFGKSYRLLFLVAVATSSQRSTILFPIPETFLQKGLRPYFAVDEGVLMQA